MPTTRAGKLSSNSKLDKKVIDSFTIRGTRKVVQAGDCVLMRPPKSGKPSYVARVEKIELHVEKNEVKVHCRWYYRPEDSPKGRKKFYGAKELFLSDHFDVQSAETIEGKCIVHTYGDYTESERVGAHDYFCRFEYKVATAKLTPDWVDVYCTCEQPHNPDKLMVQCEECNDWYHPACIGMTIGEIKKLEHYTCSECNSESSSECSSDEDVDDVEVVALAPKRRRIG